MRGHQGDGLAESGHDHGADLLREGGGPVLAAPGRSEVPQAVVERLGVMRVVERAAQQQPPVEEAGRLDLGAQEPSRGGEARRLRLVGIDAGDPLVARQGVGRETHPRPLAEPQRPAPREVSLREVVVGPARRGVVGGGEGRAVVIGEAEVAARRRSVETEEEVRTRARGGEGRHGLARPVGAVRGRGAPARAPLGLPGVDEDRAADRGRGKRGRREAAVDLDRVDLAQREIGQVHRSAERPVEGHAVEIDHHLLGRRAADRDGGERAAEAPDLHPDRLTQELVERRDPAGEVLGADDGGEGGRIEGRRPLGRIAHLDPLEAGLRRRGARGRGGCGAAVGQCIGARERDERCEGEDRRSRGPRADPGARPAAASHRQSPEAGRRGSWAEEKPYPIPVPAGLWRTR